MLQSRNGYGNLRVWSSDHDGDTQEDTMTVYESLKRPEDMDLEEANEEYNRIYAFVCPSQADFVRMSALSRRISELKYGEVK